MGLFALAACLINCSIGRQKALQPTVKPLFCWFPFGFLARKHRGIERLEALLKIPTRRASSRVRVNCILQSFAGLAV
jgi:hypothetical protein